MKIQKDRESIKKVFLIFLAGLFFFTLFIYPQYQNFENNRIILKNKKKVITAGEKINYQEELNNIEMELNLYQKLIPEQEEQGLIYDSLKEMIKISQGELIELQFGEDFIIEINELFDKEKKSDEFEDKELYGIRIKVIIEGGEIKKIFNYLESATPFLSIVSFQFRESIGKNRLELELIGYFFKNQAN